MKYQRSRDVLPWLRRLDSESIDQSSSNDPLIKPQLVREIGWKTLFLIRTYIDASGVVQDRGSGSWFRSKHSVIHFSAILSLEMVPLNIQFGRYLSGI